MIGRLLEREIAEIEADGGDPGSLAERLAMNYVTRLRTLDSAGRAALEKRLDDWIKLHPEADTIDLRVARLEDQFHQGEARALGWIDEPNDRVREEALDIFNRIEPDLKRYRDDLLDRVAQGNDQLDLLGMDANKHANLERQVLHDSQLAGRVTYFAGWAALYANWLEPAGVGGLAGFREARRCFRRLLALEDGDVVENPFDLRLESAAQARVLLGLGLSDLANGNLDAGRDAFRLLRAGETHPSVRDWLDFWEVAGLSKADRPADARQLAETAVRNLPREATPGRAALCKFLIRAGADAPAMGPIGLHGLVRMNQFDLARGLLRSNPIPPESVGGMLGLWLQGLKRLDRADRSREPADFEAAADRFRKAIDHPEAVANPALAAVCRYALGCCLLGTDRADEGVATLREAADALKAAGLDEAVDAEWMIALAEYRRARSDEEKARAGAALSRFAERHPNHPNAAIVPGILARKSERSPGPGAGPGSPPSPETSTIDSCRSLFRRWKELPSARRRDSTVASELSTALEKAVRDGLTDADRVELEWMTAEVALGAEPPDVESARRSLERLSGLEPSIPPDSTMRTALAVTRFHWARLSADPGALRKAAEVLADRGKGTPAEVEARSVLAVLADDALRKAPEDGSKRTEARRAYQKLVALLGDSPDRWKASRPSAVAALRLAELEAVDGDPESARKRVEALLAVYPSDTVLLERSARIFDETSRGDRAQEIYRTLLSGLKPGSDAWFSATIGRIESLDRIDRERARAAFARFQTLHPESSWPERRKADLDRLAERLR